jgi:hypothetical protein
MKAAGVADEDAAGGKLSCSEPQPPTPGVCSSVPRWRPNLRDEGDNHLVELAIAGGAEAIVTYNV